MAVAQKLNLFSDVLMSVALNDKEACAHVLRILTGIPTLNVTDIRVHHRVNNLIARDVIFDVLAQDADGKLYNIEIQRANTIDHGRRISLYSAELITEFSRKGTTFDEIPEVYIFYLSETDILRTGQCMDRVVKRLEKSRLSYDDGIHIAYANAEINDGTNVAGLMKYFATADPDDDSQGALSRRIHLIKKEKEGEKIMCEFSETFFSEGNRYRLVKDLWALTSKTNMTVDEAMDLLDVDSEDRPLYTAYLKEMQQESTVTAPR